MRRLLAVCLFALCAAAPPAGSDVTVLTLPRPLHHGEALVLEVQLGQVGRQRVQITTDKGLELGTVAPFGAAEKGEAFTQSPSRRKPCRAMFSGFASSSLAAADRARPPPPTSVRYV